jgi:hypothetical protein
MKTSSPARETATKDRINLRLAPEFFAAIDEARFRRPGSISRNTWIAEAIQEKLAREAHQGEAHRGGGDA